MLSDSLHEACAIIWEAIQNYDYSEEYKEELIDILTDATYLIYKLDRVERDHRWSRENMRNHIIRKWDEVVRGSLEIS